jgi:hypothetical protein
MQCTTSVIFAVSAQLHCSLFLRTLGLSGRFGEMPKFATGGQADLVALVALLMTRMWRSAPPHQGNWCSQQPYLTASILKSPVVEHMTTCYTRCIHQLQVPQSNCRTRLKAVKTDRPSASISIRMIQHSKMGHAHLIVLKFLIRCISSAAMRKAQWHSSPLRAGKKHMRNVVSMGGKSHKKHVQISG